MAAAHTLLSIYLNDHLAGSTVGCNLCKRTLAENRGSDLGDFLERLCPEIEEDRATLLDVMASAGVRENPIKRMGAVAAERAGRLKLNGQLLGYSPLSRLVELEALMAGIEGKRGLWAALQEVADPRLEQFDFVALEQRAARQHDEVDQHRRRAARQALAQRDAQPT
jgi:hypothetical protein